MATEDTSILAQEAEKPEEYKIFKVSPDAKAGIAIGKDEVIIFSDSDHVIHLTKSGTYFLGRKNDVSVDLDNNISGFLQKKPTFMELIPQTLVTPFPTVIPAVGLGQGLGDIAKQVAFLSIMVV